MLPLDFDKSNSGNVRAAQIELTAARASSGVFVLPGVFYYGSTLVISYIDVDGSTVTLRPGIDYEPFASLDNISQATDSDKIYGSVRMTNSGIAYVTLNCTAHMMGGDWTADDADFAAISRTGYNGAQYHPACRLETPINIKVGGVVNAYDIGTLANIKLLQDGTWGILKVVPALNATVVAPTPTVSDTAVDINAISDTAATALFSKFNVPVKDFSATAISKLTSMLNDIFDVKTSASIGTGLEDDASDAGGTLIARVGRIRAYMSSILTTVSTFFTDFRKTPSMAQLPTKPIMGNAVLAANTVTLPNVPITNGIPITALDTNSATVYAMATADVPAGGYAAFMAAVATAVPSYAYALSPGDSLVIVATNLNSVTFFGATGDGVKWVGGY